MTDETAIKLRCKKQLRQKMINHFAMEQMRREILASKGDLSEEMIKKMGMEELLNYLEEDFKTATLQRKRENINARNRKIYAATMLAEKRENNNARA